MKIFFSIFLLLVLPIFAACVLEHRIYCGNLAVAEERVSKQSFLWMSVGAFYPLLMALFVIASIFTERVALGHWRQDFEALPQSPMLAFERWVLYYGFIGIPVVPAFAFTFAARMQSRSHQYRGGCLAGGAWGLSMAILIISIFFIAD